ncbi:hypothetical protein CapIbe_017463 [Capra ibex]
MTIRYQGQQCRPRMAFLRKLPRPLMVHIGLRGPDCPEGVYTPHLSEKLPVTPVTHGGTLHRNAPGIAPSFPGSGPQPLRPLRRIRLPTGRWKDRLDCCPHFTGKETEASEDQHWENCRRCNSLLTTLGSCGLVISVCLRVRVLRKGSSGGVHAGHRDDGGPEEGHSNSLCGEL